MEQVLLDMISALRASGVRISLSETVDAMGAVRLVGYRDRQILKDSLSATLAKTETEKRLFDDCFHRFFSPDAFSEPHRGIPPSPGLIHDTEDAPLSQMLLHGDRTGLSISMREASEASQITGIRFFTQKSLYIQRILKGMGMEGLEGDIRRLSRSLDMGAQEKAKALKSAKHLLFENVRDFVEQQLSLFSQSATEEMMEKYLRGMRLSNLEQRDYHRMHAIIQKMVKRLKALHSRKRKVYKRGALDFKRTMRENVAYQGLLFDPRWKARKIERPDFIAICDVSRSVESVARFMLLFLYSLSEAVVRIRSFIFCSNLVEASHVFTQYPVEEALSRLQRGTGLNVQFGRTDYGRAFGNFKSQWLDGVTSKTTVIILGDARSNYADPRTDILRVVQERSKRVIWLNPEPPTFWGTGDSEMKRYQPYCYLARECSTVNHLERIVDLLLQTRG